ncbi:MAG TPA: lipoyl synthase [Desulfomonilaceae bacterium]|nr:lipoyl synthase [Desulfomonilaceae bacterium]
MNTPRLPSWLHTRLPPAQAVQKIRLRTYAQGLATVCKEAICPNQGECSQRGTATFLILGDRCTRNCSFCAVRHGPPVAVEFDEPNRVAKAVKSLQLRHSVITSVTRDDLPDGGAFVFAETVRAIRNSSPGTSVEILIPDFQGSSSAVQTIIDSAPDVIGHNLEMVPRLYAVLRQGASYTRSLKVLQFVSERAPGIITKSGIMVGLGETHQEVIGLMRDLVNAGCMALTIGQYLQPTENHFPVSRFLPPREFAELRDLGLAQGIKLVMAGPLVRSSYKAIEIFEKLSKQDVRAGVQNRSPS